MTIAKLIFEYGDISLGCINIFAVQLLNLVESERKVLATSRARKRYTRNLMIASLVKAEFVLAFGADDIFHLLKLLCKGRL